MNVLVCNVGSTSLKYRLYEMPAERLLCRGHVDRVGGDKAVFRHWHDENAAPIERTAAIADHTAAIRMALEHFGGDSIDAVGFKPVHARNVKDVVAIDEQVLADMEAFVPVAPQHNPPYMAAMRAFMELMPGKLLVGVFEPAFHRTIPDYAGTYGIPYEWTLRYAVRKYGFHGASHRYLADRTPQLLGRPAEGLRFVTAHLGGSSSLCAVRDGQSIDTSMGFSPQSGVMQTTRNGDMDPAVIPYLAHVRGIGVDELCSELASHGGLAGISGTSGDMRDLEEAAAAGNDRARLAIDVFVYEIRKFIGAFAVALGGLDALVFAGGTGENAATIRARVCDGLQFLGIELDAKRNTLPNTVDRIISPDHAAAAVLVIRTNEEIVVARETARLLGGTGHRAFSESGSR